MCIPQRILMRVPLFHIFFNLFLISTLSRQPLVFFPLTTVCEISKWMTVKPNVRVLCRAFLRSSKGNEFNEVGVEGKFQGHLVHLWICRCLGY